jgi:hypothetical protein
MSALAVQRCIAVGRLLLVLLSTQQLHSTVKPVKHVGTPHDCSDLC